MSPRQDVDLSMDAMKMPLPQKLWTKGKIVFDAWTAKHPRYSYAIKFTLIYLGYKFIAFATKSIFPIWSATLDDKEYRNLPEIFLYSGIVLAGMSFFALIILFREKVLSVRRGKSSQAIGMSVKALIGLVCITSVAFLDAYLAGSSRHRAYDSDRSSAFVSAP